MKKSGPKIAVAGAGVMGLSAAYALRHAYNVTLFDAGGKANASLIAGGMLAPFAEIEHLPPQLMEAALRGGSSWLELKNIGYAQTGSLLVAHEADAHMLERFAALSPDIERVDARRVAALEPALANRFTHGIFLAGDAHLNPALTLPTLAAAIENKTAKKFDLEKDARNFDWVIDCRGYGAAQDDPELRGVKGETVIVRNEEFFLSRPVRLMHPRYPLYITPRPNHEFMIGATVIEGADDEVSLKSAMELLSAAYSLHPSFAESRIVDIRAGIRPAYPDNLPRIKIKDNVIRCNGLFRHGYLLAPAMAACVADFIAGAENQFAHLFIRGQDDRRHQRSEKNIKRRA